MRPRHRQAMAREEVPEESSGPCKGQKAACRKRAGLCDKPVLRRQTGPRRALSRGFRPLGAASDGPGINAHKSQAGEPGCGCMSPGLSLMQRAQPAEFMKY
ncbi:hypothetical protein NDU88_001039 [Pleurodeles waltl]|uniref:Uncharacterized protein n=1 Tax=Pleurodeles waltl TaxID=8319 RepID=A0AAV7P7K2_PLEWA|nr:hypothetical protein NDU88_001039 [Pleurodeles waltl]